MEGCCEKVGLEAQENSLEKPSSGVRKDTMKKVSAERNGVKAISPCIGELFVHIIAQKAERLLEGQN